jgi:hypothetical protein
MRYLNFTVASSLAVAAAFSAGSASADQFPSSGAKAQEGVVFGALNFGDDTTYAVLGLVHAINGNIGKDGFLVHLSAEHLEYDYVNPGPTVFEADGWGGGIMLGYQFVMDKSKIALYAGVAHRDIDVKPLDPTSETAGENTAFKGQVEGYFGIGADCDLSALASYFDAAETYYTRVRAGFHLDAITLGPEVSLHGSDEYDSQEYGGFIRYVADGNLVLGARAGWADRDDVRGDDGGYFGLEVALGY